MTDITKQLAEALRKQHESHLTYSEAKRRANATCGDFKESALSALIESGYLASELGKETIAALAAFKESRGGPDTKSAVSGVQRVGVASELLDPSLHSLDAWECEACAGAGSISEPGVVTIANGEKHKSGWVDSTCPTCGGLKYCGPDAEALAAYAAAQSAEIDAEWADQQREAMGFPKQSAPSEPVQGEREAFEAALAGMSAGTYVIPGWDVHRVRNALAQQPAARVALTREQIDKIMTKHYPLDSLLRENVDAFEACVRDIEAEFCRVNGITAPTAQEKP